MRATRFPIRRGVNPEHAVALEPHWRHGHLASSGVVDDNLLGLLDVQVDQRSW